MPIYTYSIPFQSGDCFSQTVTSGYKFSNGKQSIRLFTIAESRQNRQHLNAVFVQQRIRPQCLLVYQWNYIKKLVAETICLWLFLRYTHYNNWTDNNYALQYHATGWYIWITGHTVFCLITLKYKGAQYSIVVNVLHCQFNARSSNSCLHILKLISSHKYSNSCLLVNIRYFYRICSQWRPWLSDEYIDRTLWRPGDQGKRGMASVIRCWS